MKRINYSVVEQTTEVSPQQLAELAKQAQHNIRVVPTLIKRQERPPVRLVLSAHAGK